VSARVVVTGLGVVSPAGVGCEALRGPGPRAGEGPASTPFDAAAILGPKGLRLLDRATLMTMVAGHLALEQAGLLDRAPAWAGMRAPGIVLGTSFGSLASITGYVKTRLAQGAAALNPSLFPNTVINSPASQCAIRFGLRTLCTTLAAGWASGAEAISYAADALRRGRADIVLAGGVEEASADNLLVYADLGLDPPAGFGEGAALLVLERETAALERGAAPLAELAGCGSGFAGDGPLSAALARAVAEVGLPSVDLLITGGNGSPDLDDAEHEVFAGCAAPRVALKERLGECDGAGAALAAAFGVLACSRRAASGYDTEVEAALVSAPSYTGHAAALGFKRWDG